MMKASGQEEREEKLAKQAENFKSFDPAKKEKAGNMFDLVFSFL